jgi:hypothetical protein
MYRIHKINDSLTNGCCKLCFDGFVSYRWCKHSGVYCTSKMVKFSSLFTYMLIQEPNNKANLSLYTPLRIMEEWKLEVIVQPHDLTALTRRKQNLVLFSWRLRGPQIRIGQCGEGKSLLLLSKMKQILCFPPCSLVTIPTELSRIILVIMPLT